MIQPLAAGSDQINPERLYNVDFIKNAGVGVLLVCALPRQFKSMIGGFCEPRRVLAARRLATGFSEVMLGPRLQGTQHPPAPAGGEESGMGG